MHTRKQHHGGRLPAPQSICPTLTEATESASDDPLFRALDKRKPKKYPLLWLVSRNRPLIDYFDDRPQVGFLTLHTRLELAQAHVRGFCRVNHWPADDVDIRLHTLVEAFEIARGLATPTKLINAREVCQRIVGVSILGVRTVQFYPL